MRRIVFLLLAAAFLCSCVGVESRLVVKSDGSGTLDLTYRVSQMVADLGRTGTEKVSLPIPLTREDFQRGLQDVPGVRLASYARSENEKDITIRVQLAFDSIDALSKVAAFKSENLSLTASGDRHTFTQLVVKAAQSEISQDSIQMLDTFFNGYTVSLSFEAPSQVLSSTLGTLSQDKKGVTYTASVKDLVTSKKDVVFSVTW